ncbi:MAG: TIGR03013 family XrtA/PEP-CTERM system glycosyltransferase, partial [Candidatus Acidiferrum sp.]
MIRLFNLYIPTRLLFLILGEIATVCASFSLAIFIRFRGESYIAFTDEHAFFKIFAVAILALVFSHFTEFYDLRQRSHPRDIGARVLIMVAFFSFLFGAVAYFSPDLLVGRNSFLIGLCILAISWILWRWTYERLVFHPALRERVYLIGNGERAKRIAEAIEGHGELGMDLVGWAGKAAANPVTSQSLQVVLRDLRNKRSLDRVIVALTDRRSMMPVEELLELRLDGVRIEDGTSLIEKVSGQVEVDELHPSWMIFGGGFRVSPSRWFARRIVSVALALTLSILTLPFVPIIALLIKLTSRGPVLYKQRRVGLRGKVFHCFKFRTMRTDAEADTGPTWARDDDPRITVVGRFLRRSRLDEIPQLWNVLRGDMAFVGPRPERPEFVDKLGQAIPYYNIRHVARPGITGWAQINYGYGSSVEEAKEKLRYDLYYIRNVSVILDLIIVF